MDKHKKLWVYLMFAAWLILNLIQAWQTPLHYDETYYFMYSQNLSWGYFDHPPLVALLIKAGYTLLQNSLGLRLFFVLMGSATVFLIFKLANDFENKKLFALMVFSSTLVHIHVGGFMALPDIPLVFFSTLFLFAYKQYLQNNSWKLAIFLAFIAVFMIYSKYHAVFVVAFLILANIKLLFDKKLWIVSIIVLLALIPHIIWQYNNHFPSITYHLTARAKGFKWDYIYEYLTGQLIVPGLLTGIIILYACFVYKVKTNFERALKYTIVGFYVTFFVFSFSRNIELHWTAVIMPFTLLLSYNYISSNTKLLQWFKPLAITGFVILMVLRVILMLECNNATINKLSSGFKKWQYLIPKIDSIAKGRDVLFVSNYQLASEYSYAKAKIYPSVAGANYRYTQYDIENYDNNFLHKNILIIGVAKNNSSNYITNNTGGKIYYSNINNYLNFRNIYLENKSIKCNVKPSQAINVIISIENKSDTTINLCENTLLTPFISYIIKGKRKYMLYKKVMPITDILGSNLIYSKQKVSKNIQIVSPRVKGSFKVQPLIVYGNNLRSSVGKTIILNVE